jgi:hypothetical protein
MVPDEERTRLATNEGLVTRILSIARALGRVPHIGEEAGKFLGVMSV